jgi:hypothetical protein
MQDYKRNIDGFINEDETIVKTEPKTIDYETSTVSLGNDSEALAEEKNKPKEKQDKNKIKQYEKSIKDREKQIKEQVKNNKKLKPGSNAWEGVIDDENADDWSYIVNKWKDIPEKEDFKSAAETTISRDTDYTRDFAKDREWSLNLPNKDFEEWNSYQENPDDVENIKKYEKERNEWINKAEKAINKYSPFKKGDPKYYSAVSVYKAFTAAEKAGDYDAAAILKRATYNALENEKAQKENENTKTTVEEPVKEEGKQTFTKEKAWEIYNGANGTAKRLFEDFKTLGMDSAEAKKEFLSKNPNPSQNAKKAFRDIYKSELVESKVATNKENTTTPQQTQNFQVGQAPRKVLNEAQSETSKNIKDVVLDETYQTLTADEKRDALKKATEKALNTYSSRFIDKANTRENAAQLSKFLPRFAIQHFLEGNFGDKKDPKSWGTLGYFLLDKVGKSLVNASQVARGFSPTEKTALESYNETMMKNAFGRDDENRRKILNSSLDTLVKDSDVLREVGISDFKIFDDFTEKVLTQYQDNIQNVNLDKILKEKSDFILNMSEQEQQKFIGYLIAMDVSEPGSAAYLNAAYRAADLELRYAKTDAEKYAAQKSKSEIDLKLAGLDVNNKLLFGQLDSIKLKNEKDRATMTAEIDRVIRENEKLIEEIKAARTNNEYLAKEKEAELKKKLAEVVSAYATAGSNVVSAVGDIIDAVVPF